MSLSKATYRRFSEYCSLAPAVVIFSKFSSFYILNRNSFEMFYRFLHVTDYAVLLHQIFFSIKQIFDDQKEVQSRNPGTRTSLIQDRDFSRPGKFEDFGQTRTGVHRSLVESCIVTVGLTSLGIHGPKPIGLGPDKLEFKGDLGATRKRINEKFQISDQFLTEWYTNQASLYSWLWREFLTTQVFFEARKLLQLYSW